MKILIFEDRQVEFLYPVTVGRAAFDVRCGSFSLIEQAESLADEVRAIIRPHLQSLLATDRPHLAGEVELAGPVLLLNARTVPSIAVQRQLEGLIDAGKPGMVSSGNAIAACLLADGGALPMSFQRLVDHLETLRLDELACRLPLLEYPHDIVRHHQETFADNLAARLSNGTYHEIGDGVYAADDMKLSEHVVTDTRHGPILCERGARIGPFSYLEGPLHVGRNGTVNPHAELKDGVALGHTTKVGGEVECSIIEPYSNKQHTGFLGHSYVGSWVNLGAGTSNSDLKNTYGKIKMRYRGRPVETGMQFMGMVMGDYAKAAINTSIFTGKTIGVASMLYGTVATDVPSFVNYARQFDQVTTLPPEVVVATQTRMFTRRKLQARACDAQLIRDMFELTRHERESEEISDGPLAL